MMQLSTMEHFKRSLDKIANAPAPAMQSGMKYQRITNESMRRALGNFEDTGEGEGEGGGAKQKRGSGRRAGGRGRRAGVEVTKCR